MVRTSRRERRRELARLHVRLRVAVRRGRLPSGGLTISDEALHDLQLVDPNIKAADLCEPTNPAQAAARLEADLDRMDNDPYNRLYGFDAGGRDANLAMRDAIAALDGVFREAGGK